MVFLERKDCSSSLLVSFTLAEKEHASVFVLYSPEFIKV